jgi:hypothetical protein
LKEEGWTEKDHLRKDEEDYVKMGLFKLLFKKRGPLSECVELFEPN